MRLISAPLNRDQRKRRASTKHTSADRSAIHRGAGSRPAERLLAGQPKQPKNRETLARTGISHGEERHGSTKLAEGFEQFHCCLVVQLATLVLTPVESLQVGWQCNALLY
jgi:hypothetical protein